MNEWKRNARRDAVIVDEDPAALTDGGQPLCADDPGAVYLIRGFEPEHPVRDDQLPCIIRIGCRH